MQLNPQDPLATPILARIDELFVIDAQARQQELTSSSGAEKLDPRGEPTSRAENCCHFSVVESYRRLKVPVRDYLAAVPPGLANVSIRRLLELTPAAWARRRN